MPKVTQGAVHSAFFRCRFHGRSQEVDGALDRSGDWRWLGFFREELRAFGEAGMILTKDNHLAAWVTCCESTAKSRTLGHIGAARSPRRHLSRRSPRQATVSRVVDETSERRSLRLPARMRLAVRDTPTTKDRRPYPKARCSSRISRCARCHVRDLNLCPVRLQACLASLGFTAPTISPKRSGAERAEKEVSVAALSELRSIPAHGILQSSDIRHSRLGSRPLPRVSTNSASEA
jgi:hypothetical protein